MMGRSFKRLFLAFYEDIYIFRALSRGIFPVFFIYEIPLKFLSFLIHKCFHTFVSKKQRYES